LEFAVGCHGQSIASDFHFAGSEQVQFLFASEIDDRRLRADIEQTKRSVIEKLQHPFVLLEEHPRQLTITERSIRDRAFAEAVRGAYDNACAVCGLRLDSIEGLYEVQAAHIYDRAQGGSDDIRNGLALCRTHHWAFDRKLFTIGLNYELIWYANAARTSAYRAGLLPRVFRAAPATDAPQPQAPGRSRLGYRDASSA
jgi:putative restriction endonuclease